MPLQDNISDREKDKFGFQKGRTYVNVNPNFIEANKLNVKRTEVSTAPVKIDFPEEGNEFLIYHDDASGSVWLGDNDGIAADTGDVAPLLPNMRLPVYVAQDNDNELYGITSSGTISVFVLGMIRDI